MSPILKQFVCVICVYYIDGGSGRGGGRKARDGLKERMTKTDTAKLLNLG